MGGSNHTSDKYLYGELSLWEIFVPLGEQWTLIKILYLHAHNIWSCFVFLFVLFTCLFKTGDFSSLCSELIAFSRAYLHPVLLKTSKVLSESIDWNFFSVVSALGRNVGRERMVPPQMCLEELQNRILSFSWLSTTLDGNILLLKISYKWSQAIEKWNWSLRSATTLIISFYGNRRFCASCWGEMPSTLHLTTNMHYMFTWTTLAQTLQL